jgi:hypothetical protein
MSDGLRIVGDASPSFDASNGLVERSRPPMAVAPLLLEGLRAAVSAATEVFEAGDA